MAKKSDAVNVVSEIPPDKLSPRSAVINPYTLAELIVGRKIFWSEVEDVPQLLEDILQTPYEELFDPKYEGPLYTGLRLNRKLELEPVRSPLLDIEIKVDLNDLSTPLDGGEIHKLADLGPRFKTDNVGEITVKKAEFIGQRYIQLTVALPDKERLQRLARVFTKDIVRTISVDPKEVGQIPDWTPPNGSWTDPGQFFQEAAEFFDPIQGSVANCYFIAALSAVAWAQPYRIKHMTRAIGQTQQSFTNLIRFFKPDSNETLDKEIEVTDTLPVNSSSGNLIYARSSEAGEIWPGVYEKAFAKLKTGTTGDRPDITATGWGDTVFATAQLTGKTRYYYNNEAKTSDQLWDLVRANSLSRRTFNPMVCWTYSSGDASSKKIVYSTANIVASHAYTILGWEYRNGLKYIILRNPWGNTEASVQTLNSTVWLYDISWWRPINLTSIDGTFAIEASAFKTYFAGMGVVK